VSEPVQWIKSLLRNFKTYSNR